MARRTQDPPRQGEGSHEYDFHVTLDEDVLPVEYN